MPSTLTPEEMDGNERQLSFEEAEEEQAEPSAPMAAQPVTMAGIASLLTSTLDVQFGPVQAAVESIKTDLGTLKTLVQENEDMMQENIESIHRDINSLSANLDATIDKVTVIEDKLDSELSAFVRSFSSLLTSAKSLGGPQTLV